MSMQAPSATDMPRLRRRASSRGTVPRHGSNGRVDRRDAATFHQHAQPPQRLRRHAARQHLRVLVVQREDAAPCAGALGATRASVEHDREEPPPRDRQWTTTRVPIEANAYMARASAAGTRTQPCDAGYAGTSADSWNAIPPVKELAYGSQIRKGHRPRPRLLAEDGVGAARRRRRWRARRDVDGSDDASAVDEQSDLAREVDLDVPAGVCRSLGVCGTG